MTPPPPQMPALGLPALGLLAGVLIMAAGSTLLGRGQLTERFGLQLIMGGFVLVVVAAILWVAGV